MDYFEAAMMGFTALKEGQSEKALRLLDTALSEANASKTNAKDKKCIVYIKEIKACVYAMDGNKEDAMREMEEAQEYNSKLKHDRDMDAKIGIQASFTFFEMGEMEKAMECVDSLSIKSMPRNLESADFFMQLASIYLQCFKTNGDRVKKLLHAAKAIIKNCDAEKKEKLYWKVYLYRRLAQAAMIFDGDKGKMQKYALKSWSCAQKVAPDDALDAMSDVMELCQFVASNTTEEDRFFWFSNLAEATGRMLEANYQPLRAAKMYTFANFSLYPFYVYDEEEQNLQYADLCLDLLRDGTDVELELGTAQWLWAYKHTQDKSYLKDQAMQRKMTTLLNRSAETMEKRDHECSPIYACVKSV
ncbi:MAG: hypothetical protein LBT59_03215, partial [Clostridiales bacterium]|nr:hypothetical protein [Clostridiales bacterium]